MPLKPTHRPFPPFRDETSLFLQTSDGKYEFLDGVGVERVLWQGGIQRILLCGILSKFLLDFPDDCTLVLQHALCGPADCFVESETILTFQYCKMLRRWMPHPVMLGPANSILLVYVSIGCEVVPNWPNIEQWHQKVD
jgi:hypothetical protein